MSHIYKGSPPAHLRLFSENSTARFQLQPNKDYLLFVTTERFDIIGAKPTIDVCGVSGPVEDSQASLSAVDRLSHLGRQS